MSRRPAIEAALAAWRDAERRLATATDGNAEALKAAVARHREEFHRLSGDHMADQIDRLRAAEQRRMNAVPSSPPFHAAAQEEKALAAEIWEEARASDEETPQPARSEPTSPG